MMCRSCRVAGNLLGVWTELTPKRLRTIAVAHEHCDYPISCTCQHRPPDPGVSERQQALLDGHLARRGELPTRPTKGTTQ